MSPDASTPRADAAGVVALDRLAEALVAGVPGARVALAATEPELTAVLRLRHDHVVAHGWARGDALGDGVERDEHDAGALHVAAWDGAALMGAMRVVLPAPGRRLPVEAAFGLDVEPHGAVVEAGRLVIAPAHRGDPAHRTWGALFGRAWLELRARGHTVLAGAASPRMVERLRGAGLPFDVLAPARPYWGELRHPVRLDPAADRPGWFDAGRRRPPRSPGLSGPEGAAAPGGPRS